MSRRDPPPLVPREFQKEAIETLAAALLDAAEKIRAAPAQRRRITLHIGCALLEAPTGAGKTVMLAAAAERISADAPVVWFWFAPFKGVVEQTGTALRRSAPGLRVRDPRADRNSMGTRPGDVFIATWAAVAATNAESRKLRTDDDIAPALDTLVEQLRAAGCLLGVVVDEAHHSFRPNSQAFRFFQDVLRPDVLMLATATPDDSDVETLRRAMDIVRFQRVTVSRTSVVAERLNKRAVKAISFVARGASQGLLDLNEVALSKAVDQHRALKQALRAAHIPLVPLLLVQAASTAWTPAHTKKTLVDKLGFGATAVAVHTADEPDPNLQALAQDPDVEVLVFKMAVATGFDAPRASTLCALRPIQDAGFGLQVIGRIMRVHPLLQARADLPAEFDTGYVFLGDAEGQRGLQTAADRLKAMRDSISVFSDSLTLYVADAESGNMISITDESGQRALVLTAPEEPPVWVAPDPPAPREAAFLFPRETLFGQLSDALEAPHIWPRPQTSGSADASASDPPRRRLPYAYAMRPNVPVPRRLRTEKMPTDTTVLVDTLVRNVSFTAEHMGIVHQQRAPVERRETDLFDAVHNRRTEEQATISDLFARETALRTLRVSEHIDPQVLARRLAEKLLRAIADAGGAEPPQGDLRRALNIILAKYPRLCRDALRRAMAACTEVIEAADLPMEWESAVPLPPSPLNLYGCRPDLNTWEEAFADWLDRQPDRVIWWLRNSPRPTATDDWGVRIVLPESGRGYYPDFVVCVEGRRKPDGIGLAETKERIESSDAAAKSRTEHREYGRALMLSYDVSEDRFFRVEYAPDLGRNREVALLMPGDLVSD